MDAKKLKLILKKHKDWLDGKPGGERADLRGADLRGADLRKADLSEARLDYSCWPLWCGSIGVKIDRRLFAQLLGHLLVVRVDDPECQKIQQLKRLRKLAATGHRAKELGLK